MRLEILCLILGMALVTYIPRVIPAIFTDKLHFNGKVEKFLRMIPYTAMSALVFPSIFTVDSAHWQVGVVGGLAAALLAWIRLPVAATVLGSVAATLAVYLIGGAV